jgi:chromosomal replication initiation ATPase DnaA
MDDEHAMQLVMPFARMTSYATEDFIRGAANEEALAVIERWPDWPYSILLLHGPKACGKTHLAHLFAARSGATFIDPARVGSAPADHLLVGHHAWVLDGVEAVREEAALAQLINHARARGDYLLLTAHAPAAQLAVTLPDLRSRLLALPTIRLGAPDDALLMGVLAKQFADRQLRIAPEVLTYAAQQLERSYEATVIFVRAMDRLSLTRGRAITVPLVREALQHPDWQPA